MRTLRRRLRYDVAPQQMEGMQCSDVKIFEAALGARSPWRIAARHFEASPRRRPIRVDCEAGGRFAAAGQRRERRVPGTVSQTGRQRHCPRYECTLDEGSQGPATADR